MCVLAQDRASSTNAMCARLKLGCTPEDSRGNLKRQAEKANKGSWHFFVLFCFFFNNFAELAGSEPAGGPRSFHQRQRRPRNHTVRLSHGFLAFPCALFLGSELPTRYECPSERSWKVEFEDGFILVPKKKFEARTSKGAGMCPREARLSKTRSGLQLAQINPSVPCIFTHAFLRAPPMPPLFPSPSQLNPQGLEAKPERDPGGPRSSQAEPNAGLPFWRAGAWAC